MIDVSAKFKADMAKNNKLLSNIEVTVKRDDENILHKKIFSHGKKNLLFLPCNTAVVQNLYREICIWSRAESRACATEDTSAVRCRSQL